MFGKYKYKRLDEDLVLAKHLGVFRQRIGPVQATALIMSATIGAGVLGIPYAVSRVGLTLGILYIIVIGLLLLTLNLLVGEVVAGTDGEFQLVGLARKYLGRFGGYLMTILNYLMAFGILVVYIIGEGKVLANLFGGDAFWWSVGFFLIGSILVAFGLQTIKTFELLLSFGILVVIVLIAGLGAQHVQVENLTYHNLAYLLLPYGVILFSFSGAGSIPEAHTLLKNRDTDFRNSIIVAGLIIMVAYILFTLVTVGVTGAETTEIATIGLGQKIGTSMFLLGNIFAMLAMGTCFLLGGVALRDSLRWDYKLSNLTSFLLVCLVPISIFLLGLRSFIEAIDIVGGVFVSLEMLLLVLIYWRAKHLGHLKPSKYRLHHIWLLIAPLILAFTVGAVYSVVRLF